MDKERTDLEKENNYIELHCKQCNMRMMDYTLCYNDELVVLQGITMKCHRCKRVMMLKKYSEGFLRKHARNGMFRI